MAKPRKKYRKKPVRIPPVIMRIDPDLPDAKKRDLSLFHRVPFDALCRGEGTKEGWKHARIALQTGYVMTEACEEKWELRASILMGIVALDVCAVECADGHAPARFLQEPAAIAFDVVESLQDTLTREDMLNALYAFDDAHKRRHLLTPYNPDAVRIVDPAKVPSWKRIEGRPALTSINGKARTGYVDFDDDAGALFWVDPADDIKVRIQQSIVVLLRDPEKQK